MSAADEHPDVYAAVAIHPNETGAVSTPEREPGARRRSRALAAPPQVRRDRRDRARLLPGLRAPGTCSRTWFRAHIELAKQTGKALMIHDRDAHEDVLAILAEYAPWPPDR